MVKDAIRKVVSEHTGIKAVELVMEVSRQVASMDSYETELQQLIDDGEVIEVEYTLPHMDYRVKSIYFPKDTVIEIMGKAS